MTILLTRTTTIRVEGLGRETRRSSLPPMLFLPAGKSRCRRVAAAFVAPEMLQWGLTGGKPGLERHRKARRLAKSNSDATLPKPATVKAMLKHPALMEAYRFQEHPILSRVEMLAAEVGDSPRGHFTACC
jgi:hypothetical protein